MSAASLLAAVEEAIEKVLAGEHTSYSIDGRSVTRLDLDKLFQRRSDLQKELARSSSATFRLARFKKRG